MVPQFPGFEVSPNPEMYPTTPPKLAGYWVTYRMNSTSAAVMIEPRKTLQQAQALAERLNEALQEADR